MREKFYGLLREYTVTLRERDLCEEQVRAAPEGIEREQASRRLELTHKRCVALRLEIKRYPDVNALPRTAAPNNPPRRYAAQAS
jgi:hypothetical protein